LLNNTRGSSLLDPDAIIVHPNQYAAMRLSKDGQSQFFGGAPLAPSSSWCESVRCRELLGCARCGQHRSRSRHGSCRGFPRGRPDLPTWRTDSRGLQRSSRLLPEEPGRAAGGREARLGHLQAECVHDDHLLIGASANRAGDTNQGLGKSPTQSLVRVTSASTPRAEYTGGRRRVGRRPSTFPKLPT
jgi:hypothetical protein